MLSAGWGDCNMALSDFSLRLSQAASKSSWVRRVLAIFGIRELNSGQPTLRELYSGQIRLCVQPTKVNDEPGQRRPPTSLSGLPRPPARGVREAQKDIAQRGVQVAIELTPEGEILDGHQRVRACQELKIKNYPRRIISGLDEEGKRHHALKANCLRRQLTRLQKKELIASELKRKPRQSNRLLAEVFGVDDKTIAAYRHELELTAEIPQLESFVGKNGKVYRPSSMFAATPAAARMAQTLLSELGDDVPEGKHLSPRTASELINQKRRERSRLQGQR